MLNNELKLITLLSKSIAFVEATEIEELYLRTKYFYLNWKKYTKPDCLVCDHKFLSESWFDLKLATVNDRPIIVRFRFCLLNEKLICFWEPVSVLVDYKIICEFFESLLEFDGLEFGVEEFDEVVEIVIN